VSGRSFQLPIKSLYKYTKTDEEIHISFWNFVMPLQ